MYVANVTGQFWDFLYRMPGSPRIRMQRVEAMAQIEVSGPLQPEDIDLIVEQHAPYGMVKADEIGHTRTHISSLYSVGKPISASQMRLALDRNVQVLTDRGIEIRKTSAIVTSDNLQERGQTNFKSVELEVVQEGEDKELNERIVVNRRGEAPSPAPRRRRAA